MKTRELRVKFLEYFTARGHQLVPSSTLVPENDSSLLFTNAISRPFFERLNAPG